MGLGGGYTERQARHFAELVERYTARTRGSKAYAAGNRPFLADNRASLNFRMANKELLYPVVGERSDGSRMWDVDGNEYIDFTIGFGVHFFGHRPPFVVQAVEEQIRRGFHLGPQSDLAGPVAKLFSELTGMERVTFCNTGSEAIMTALRIARTVTGRDRVVMFDGSYHGCFDGILARRAGGSDDEPQSRPVAPGTPQGMIDDVVVLQYGTPEALAYLRRHAGELAAVLVEPVQNRNPEFHPREFLREVRDLTRASGTVLVWDEMITGLRLEPGGAQGFYGIDADLATYGKVIGGGFPLGVVAGRAEMMDAVDGGMWNFGDDSYPPANQTFFAGTFCKHPVTMAAAYAVLRHLKERGQALYDELNARTARLVEALRRVIAEEEVPMYMLHCASLFHFRAKKQKNNFIDLLFYHMLERGIYIWEGRACFLSTAHTDEDCDRLVQAFRESIGELRRGGFLPDRPGPGGGGGGGASPSGDAPASGPAASPAPAAPAADAAPSPGVHASPDGARSFPLTSAQRLIWVHAQLGDDASRAYNEQIVLGLRGRLDAEALRAAVADLVEHHEALRTVFDPSGELQHVLPSLPVPLAVHGDDAAGPDRDALREAMADAVRGVFDLAAGPLFRVHVHVQGPEHHVVQLVVHHLVADALGAAVLTRDLETALAARREGRAPALPRAMQFGEYAALLAAHVAAHAGREAEWLAQFEGAAPLALPYDRPRPQFPTSRGGSHTLTLREPLTSRVREFGRKHGCTLFMTLLGGLMATLHRLSDQDDVVVGIPSAGRGFPGSEGMVGHCVDVLPVRSRMGAGRQVREYMRDVRGWLLGAYDDEVFSYARLQEMLRVPRGPALPPLIPVVFNLEPVPQGSGPKRERTFAGMRVEGVGAPKPLPKFDLSIDALDRGGEIDLICLYNADLFDAETVERILGLLERLLDGFAARPEERVAEVELLDAAERARVLDEWNLTARPWPRGVGLNELFEAQVAARPDAPALVWGDVELSYRELDARANRLAHVLRGLGVGPDARVGVMLERGVELIVSILAVIKADGAYVPLDPGYPAERLRLMLEDSGVRVLLTRSDLAAAPELAYAFDADELAVVRLDEAADALASQPAEPVRGGADPENLAYIVYTSGSTGRPKGVMVAHRHVVQLVVETDYVRFAPGDRVAQASNASFDALTFEAWGALLNGATLVGIPRDVLLSPPAFREALRAQGITTLYQTTALLNQLSREQPDIFAPLREVLFGGQAADADSVRRLLRAGKPRRLLHMYGPTETTAWCSYENVENVEEDALTVSVGRGTGNQRIYLLDSALNPVSVGLAGEAYVGGDGVVRGYLDRPALTAERFLPDPFAAEPGARMYRTGDRLRWTVQGKLEFVGRVDEQVKVRGFRIEPGEIEAVLCAHEGVSEARVVVREDEPGEQRLVAYVVGGADADALREHLRRSLPEYMVPAAFVALEQLPLTPNGKLDVRALPAPDFGADGRHVAPRTPAEEVLAGIWAEVLKLERVGRHDHFFELGGHSLLATRMISRVREVFRVELPVRAVFEGPTVAELAEQVEALRRAEVPVLPPVAPVDRSGALPLSFAQERLWFLDRLQPGSSFYNIPVARRLGGALDRDALERALGEIVRRHEALRTVFHEREGAPVQVVAPFDGFTLAVEDLSGLDDAEREEEVRRQVAESGARPFDLAEGPLFRAKLLRLDEEDHVLLLRMHHIVADGWSIGVLFGEMWTLYWAFREGGESPLRELPVQYGDFAVWQREQLQGEAMERQLAWWRERLAGAPALLELPADRARPAVQTYRGAYERVAFSGELLERLDALGRSEGATLYMVLLGAFQVLLGRYARSEDVVVGSPIAGRTRSETEGLIGFFVNTLVLRTDLSGDPAFREVLRRVREMVLGAYEHQDLPFEKLVEELQPERSLSHSPLFQAMFSLDNTARSRSGLTGMRVGGVEQESEVAKFDLTLSLVAHADGISGGMEYSTDLFERSTIERMLGHLERVLEQVAARPQAPVSELVLPGDAERRRVLEEWNATAEALPGGEALLHELVEAQVRRTPDAVAVVFEGSSLTYAQLDARANRLAHHLVERGVGPDTRVAVCAGRSLELVVGLLAVLKAGGAYVPLDPAYPAGRLRSMLEDGAPALLLTQAPLAGLFAGAELPVVELDDASAAWTRGPEGPPRRAAAGPGPDHLAYMIFTSGSTGRPKGAMNAHRGIVNRLLWMQREYGLGAADAVLQKTPFSFDVSVWEFFWPLIAGARLVVARPEGHRDPRYLAELIGREGVTTLHFVPPMLQLFLEETDAGCCATVRRVVCSGEALPQELQDRFFARFPGAELHNLYGPTEAAVDVTFHACRAGEPVAIGRPVANTRVYVLDAAGEPAPTGVPGELYIGGVQVGRGYLGRPELTAERFVPDAFGDRPGARLYRTGDLARWRPEGTVEFLGRVDFQVKVRGFRIEPGEIEARLAEHPDVREAVVLAQGAGSGDRRLVAYYVAAEAVEVEALRTHLSERLPEYMVPTAFVRLDSLPLTSNGKLDRRALPSPAGDAYATRAYEAPVGEIEEALAGIWSQVLGVERVGRRDHFFELGGHSLRAVQVVSRVRQLLHVEAALGEIFLRPVLADFARGLDPEARAELPPIEPADRGAPLPVSFAQRRLWFVDRMGGTGAAYHISTRLRLRGELDRGALVRALDTIVARHEALRTTFVQVDAEPAQRIAPVAESAFRLLDHDLAGLGEAAAEAELLRLMAEETGAPFDLERGPLIRGRLARLGPDDHALLVTMHHIVSDGWSMGVFMDELSALYTAFHRGDEDPLPPLPVQYADYAAWQRRWLDGDVLGQQADFWKRTLAGAPEQLELPTDHARPAQQDFAGAAVRVELDEELTAGLKALSRRHGATLFMTVLAGWAATLGRLAGQDDVVVGTPAANRGRSEVEGLIGFFINTLALRVDLSGQATVADLLAQVKAGVLAAQQHQDIPFEQVVELVQPARSLARNPLFQVALAWQNTPRGSLELPGLTFGSAGSAPHVTSQFDMSLTLLEAGGWIVGNLTYATALFRQETAERWIGYLRSVLREMVEDERRPVSGLAMLDGAERSLVVEEWNRTARPWPRGVGMNELFEAQVAARPDAPALAWGEVELSYRELDARANRLAHHLRGLGVGPDARVGVMLERGVELVVAILAVIKAGGAYVPLDPGYPAERLRLMLEDSGVRVLLTRSDLAATPELAGAFDAEELTVVHLDRSADALASQPTEPVRGGADPENLAYIVYTSGSTGRPKGVMVAHRHVVQLVVETDYVRFAPGDRIAQASNASFDALTFEAWGALLNGATLVGIPRDVLLSPAAFRETLRAERITTLYQTTALLNQLSREQPDIFAPLREVLFGGQAADADSVRRLLRAGKPRRLLHMYGPTETTAWCSYENVEHVHDDALTVSVGRGTGNQRIYLLDPALNPVPVGVAGEAYVGGDGVVRGYLDRPELTSERFLPDPFAAEPGARMYRTGDRLRWTAEGKLEFVGRVDEQVKVRGFRIEPGEIEAVLCAHEGVSEARVIVREDEPGEQRLVAYVVGEADADAMREHLRRSLPEYMVPAAFVALEQLPLTPNGKLDVRALPAPELGAAEERYVAPRTPVEEVLAEIWAGVLGVERVGAHDDFFELGGHSLLIMRLLAEIQAVFGLSLSIRTVFAMPTLESMALEVERLVYEDIAAMPEVQAEQLVELIPAAGE
jgi:amino acid adenylation domain-containing protein